MKAAEVRANANNVLIGHHLKPPGIRDRLARLAQYAPADAMPDGYGQGEYLQAFEAEVARLFGKEAAVFMPSGTMAQQIALRLWCEQAGNMTVAMHPSSHLETAEQGGLAFLHGINRLQFGAPEFMDTRVLLPADLEGLALAPGAVLLEVPCRPLGGQLPEFTELAAMSGWCRDRGIRLHLDGARIWNCEAAYGRSLADIGSLFDSIYVSFYKDLGGVAGCMLLGPADFIGQARVWQRRHGGNLPDMSPLVVAAREGMETCLPALANWNRRARETASVLAGIDGVIVNPDPPQVNFYQLYLRGEPETLVRRHHELSAKEGTWLFGGLREAPLPGYSWCELHHWENSLRFDLDRLAPFVTRLLAPA